MHRRLPVFVAIALGTLLAGCFAVPQQMSCDYRKSGANGCVDLLTNRNSQFASTLQSICEVGGGSFSTPALCDRSGALGGCLCESCENGRSVTWIYPPGPDGGITTVGALQSECQRQGRPYVDGGFVP